MTTAQISALWRHQAWSYRPESCGLVGYHLGQWMITWSTEKKSCLVRGYIGDEILSSYIGIFYISQWIVSQTSVCLGSMFLFRGTFSGSLDKTRRGCLMIYWEGQNFTGRSITDLLVHHRSKYDVPKNIDMVNWWLPTNPKKSLVHVGTCRSPSSQDIHHHYCIGWDQKINLHCLQTSVFGQDLFFFGK